MKMTKEKAKAIVLSASISVVALIVYFNLLLTPNLRALSELSPKVINKSSDLERANTAIANIANFKQKLSSLKSEVGDYEARLPSEKEVASVLDYLSRIASATGVKIIEIRELEKLRRKEDPRQLYDEVLISMTTMAGFHQIGRFINKVETSTRLMKVREFQIRVSPGTFKEHNVKLIIGVFVLKG